MFFKLISGYVGGITCIIAAIIYLRAISAGKVHSNKVTWGIWVIVTASICVYYYQTVGFVASIWVSIAYFIGTTLTFLLLLKNNQVQSEWTWVEKMAVMGVVVVLVLRIVSGSALNALLLTMLIDAIGAIPLIITVYSDPRSEYGPAWLWGFASNAINLFAVEKWDYGNAGYPIYLAILTLTISVLIYLPRFFQKSIQN